MDKVKIAFFAEVLIADFDGAARTMFQLIERIDSTHFEFLFICANGPERLLGFECVKVPSFNIPLNKRYPLAIPYLAQKQLKCRLDSYTPDVIHIATPSLLGHFGLHYAKSKHIPVISIYHTHFISYLAYYFSKLPFLIGLATKKMIHQQNDFYNNCDLIYVPSESIALELQSKGMENNRIRLWKRGIDLNLFNPMKKDKRLTERITGNKRPCILFASRLVWEKNLKTLIAVYELAQQRELSYNFIIVGDGAAMKQCRLRMPHAFFMGQLSHEQLAPLYASATVFLFPSITETFGNVVLEAMASGLPCVIADGGGSKDFITDGENGYKCDASDVSSFLDRIEQIATDHKLARQLAASALSVCQNYDWPMLADTYFNDLNKLAKKETNPVALKKLAS
ncbi:glycosyltransferase family 4 protein [Olivibacter sitiensis]|uniref:glycosyltransferase family 4 protein n=1 Tax=Olivibacter sitiensis TaxID=376470 RepID=UPI000415221F|nr:glycosyltransferase family 1 protein [Olivibacter sitiensis]